MIYGVMFTVCGTFGDVDKVTKGFDDRGIRLEFPSQIVDILTPIIVKCVAPDKETHEWMIKRLYGNDKIGALYPFFSDVETKSPPRPSAMTYGDLKEIIDEEVEKLREKLRWF